MATVGPSVFTRNTLKNTVWKSRVKALHLRLENVFFEFIKEQNYVDS